MQVALARSCVSIHFLSIILSKPHTWYCLTVNVVNIYNTSRATSNVGSQAAHLVQRLGDELDDRFSIPGRGNDGIFRHRIQTGSGAHLSSHHMATGGSYPVGKAADP
jgi:hypothetical protein